LHPCSPLPPLTSPTQSVHCEPTCARYAVHQTPCSRPTGQFVPGLGLQQWQGYPAGTANTTNGMMAASGGPPLCVQAEPPSRTYAAPSEHTLHGHTVPNRQAACKPGRAGRQAHTQLGPGAGPTRGRHWGGRHSADTAYSGKQGGINTILESSATHAFADDACLQASTVHHTHSSVVSNCLRYGCLCLLAVCSKVSSCRCSNWSTHPIIPRLTRARGTTS
jgi:hypothetical protein